VRTREDDSTCGEPIQRRKDQRLVGRRLGVAERGAEQRAEVRSRAGWRPSRLAEPQPTSATRTGRPSAARRCNRAVRASSSSTLNGFRRTAPASIGFSSECAAVTTITGIDTRSGSRDCSSRNRQPSMTGIIQVAALAWLAAVVAVADQASVRCQWQCGKFAQQFAGAFDPQPFHLDEEPSSRLVLRFFGGVAASEWHTAALTMRLLVQGELRPAGGIRGASFPLPADSRTRESPHVAGTELFVDGGWPRSESEVDLRSRRSR